MNEEDHRSLALQALTDEAREHWKPAGAPNWRRLEQALDQEEQRMKHAKGWRYGGIALAVAAGAIAWFARGETRVRQAEVRTAAPGVLSHVVRTLGDATTDRPGSVRKGETLHVTGTGRVVLAHERAGKKLTWALSAVGEPAAALQVSTEGDALRLVLDQGSVECDVEPGSPVPLLLVDAGTTRVVVRGTHFRVERHGGEVRVDLTRGKVSIERQGDVPHMLVAPVHAVVRGSAWEEDRSVREEESFEMLQAAAAVAPSMPAPTLRAPLSRTQLSARVEACVAKGLPEKSANASVTVDTVLAVTVDGSGKIVASQFSPPLHPEAERCAQEVMRNQSVTERGTILRLPFTVSR